MSRVEPGKLRPVGRLTSCPQNQTAQKPELEPVPPPAQSQPRIELVRLIYVSLRRIGQRQDVATRSLRRGRADGAAQECRDGRGRRSAKVQRGPPDLCEHTSARKRT